MAKHRWKSFACVLYMSVFVLRLSFTLFNWLQNTAHIDLRTSPRIVAGQTKPITFDAEILDSEVSALDLEIEYQAAGEEGFASDNLPSSWRRCIICDTQATSTKRYLRC